MARRWGRLTAGALALGLLLGAVAGAGAGCGDGIIGHDGRPPAAGGADVVGAGAGTIRGLVQDADGQGVPGAQVTTTPPSGVAVSDAEGAYELVGVPAGTYALTVERPGFAPATRAGVVVTADGTAFVDVTLVAEAAAGRVVGTVTDAALGTPLGGARVTLAPGAAETTAAADGRFVFEGVAAGAYTAAASHDGYVAASATVTVAAGEDATVALALAPVDEAGVIEGTIAQGDCATPIEGARVSTEPASVEATAAADGRYRLEGLAPGAYAVRAAAEGYADGAADATVTAGGTTTTNLCLAALPAYRSTCEACHAQEGELLADLAADPIPEAPGEAGSAGEG